MSTKIRDLKAIAGQLKKSGKAACGVGISADYLGSIRNVTSKLPIPEEFYVWSSEINGLWSDRMELYALHEKGCGCYLTDILEANEGEDSSKRIVLGKNDLDYLVYLPGENRYELQDRISGVSIAVFATLADAIMYLFDV